MLALFKQETASLNPLSVIERARALIHSCLDKGIVPNLETLTQLLSEQGPLNENDQTDLLSWYKNILELNWLAPLIRADTTEIFGHGPDFIESYFASEVTSTTLPLNALDWDLMLDLMAVKHLALFNEKNPFASFYATLQGAHFRLTLIHGCTNPEGKRKFFLRHLRSTPLDLLSFVDQKTKFFLSEAIRNKKNILIAGSTGSGKTTFMSSCLSQIAPEEHLIILEDTYEIMIHHPRLTRLLADEKCEEKSLKSYLSYAMRMSPERLVVGEMRSKEVIPFLLAMNTGHKGLMSTIHASSAYDALHRVAQLFSLYAEQSEISYEQIMSMICRNIELVVFLEKKQVKQIIQVHGCEQGHPLFEEIVV